MILIFYANDVPLDRATELEKELQAKYDGKLDIVIAREDGLTTWPKDRAWDDLIIVIYNADDFSPSATNFLNGEVFATNRDRPVLPISVGSRNVPPQPLERFKSMPYELAKNVRRVGAILGMSIRTRDQKLFVSYRMVDGKALAEQVADFLTSHGYNIWRDEAKDDYDQQGSIPPGEDVQKVIEKNLETADLIVLLDTPSAADSKWIHLEVNTANGLLIPVFPVVVHAPDEKVIVSRFRSLASLQRGLNFETTSGTLTNEQLESILDEIERFLGEIFRRKLRVPYLMETEFTGKGYTWSARDHIIYEALKNNNGRFSNRVYSHCSHFEGIFDPALNAFVKHVGTAVPTANYKLYVYDGRVISQEEIQQIQHQGRIEEETTIIILHYQEIAALLRTNFGLSA